MKPCNKCGKNKKIDSFGTRKNSNKTKKVYRSSYCKNCMSKLTALWVKKNKERFNAYQRRYKIKHGIRVSNIKK